MAKMVVGFLTCLAWNNVTFVEGKMTEKIYTTLEDFAADLEGTPFKAWVSFKYSPGASYMLLNTGKSWQVIEKEPGRSDVYYEREWISFSDAAADMLRRLHGA